MSEALLLPVILTAWATGRLVFLLLEMRDIRRRERERVPDAVMPPANSSFYAWNRKA